MVVRRPEPTGSDATAHLPDFIAAYPRHDLGRRPDRSRLETDPSSSRIVFWHVLQELRFTHAHADSPALAALLLGASAFPTGSRKLQRSGAGRTGPSTTKRCPRPIL